MAEETVDATTGQALLKLAARTLAAATADETLPAAPTEPPALTEPGAAFVTLQHDGDLRGCIGSLEAYRPLGEDVIANARAAAFRDPRFPPLQPAELPGLHVEVSVLTAPEPLPFNDETDLLDQLQPGVDGLILEAGARHRGTFLPAVWESLPEPQRFLAELRRKAGLPADYPLTETRLWRYTTHAFGGIIRDTTGEVRADSA
ncbi:MAG: AmmeMemoRadiSam system protein A [Pseudomonadota bacterium]